MIRHLISLSCCLLLLNGCTSLHLIHPDKKPRHGLETTHIDEFVKVNVQGPIAVNLKTGYKESSVVFHGDSRDLIQLDVSVNNRTLYINLGKGYPKFGPISVDIKTHYLTGIYHKGSGNLVAKNIQSRFLDVFLDGSGNNNLQGDLSLRTLHINGSGSNQISGINSPSLRIDMKGHSRTQLAGKFNLTELTMGDKGWLSLYWVKSSFLKLSLKGHAYLQLAGTIDKLDAELFDSAHFNGRYVRVENLFMKTHDQSVAEISAINRQHTLANDMSDIYFYNLPVLRTDFMACNGSVLDMRDWNDPLLHEYTRYNK